MVRSTKPGLLAYIDGSLRSINPEPGYFIVNFGSSIEVLTAHLPTPVRANIHGVARTIRSPNEEDRVSYVGFLDSDMKVATLQVIAEHEKRRCKNGIEVLRSPPC